MRLDHIAYRVADRNKTAEFFVQSFDYSIVSEFFPFEDDSVKCYAMKPPEKIHDKMPWDHLYVSIDGKREVYHTAPEIFVSDGKPGSVVGDWVKHRDGVGGIHHLAYMVNNVADTMKLWQEKGYAEFTTNEPLQCPGLVQCFTKPSQLTGVIYEFIERQGQGFCVENVKDLMNSTKGL
jgi:catechol 2,3-dioxygenase-like lactoylglutathione lyase family enzyme